MFLLLTHRSVEVYQIISNFLPPFPAGISCVDVLELRLSDLALSLPVAGPFFPFVLLTLPSPWEAFWSFGVVFLSKTKIQKRDTHWQQ